MSYYNDADDIDDGMTGEQTPVAICNQHGWQRTDDRNQQGTGDDHHHRHDHIHRNHRN